MTPSVSPWGSLVVEDLQAPDLAMLWLWTPSPAHRDLRKRCCPPFLRLRLASSGERGAGCGRGERLADSLASCTHFTLKTKEEGSGIFIVHPFQERAAQL